MDIVDNKVKGNVMFGFCILLLLVAILPMGDEYFFVGGSSNSSSNSTVIVVGDSCPANTYCEYPSYTNNLAILNYSDIFNVPIVVKYES